MADLLPCPFCGCVPELIEAQTGAEDVWLVRCTGIDCQCKTLNHYGKEQSVFIWNKRIIPHVQRVGKVISPKPELVMDSFDQVNCNETSNCGWPECDCPRK